MRRSRKKKKINIVAIHTAIFQQYFASKVVVSLLNLSYLFLALLVVDLEKNLLECTQDYLIWGVILFAIRIWLAFFRQVCGECHTALRKIDRCLCPKCGNYNVYDLEKWTAREFDNIKKIHWVEFRRVLLEIFAVAIVLCVFIAPIVYYSLIILNQPLSETLAWILHFIDF